MKRLRMLAWGAALALGVVASGQLVQSPLQAQAAQGGLIKDGNPPDLFLIYTGDVIGYIDPCG